jgi:putative membrane protein
MMGYGYGGWGWMMVLNGLFWLLIMGLAVALVVRALRSAPPSGRSGASPLDVLGERYARGEIQRDEYLSMKRDLLGGANVIPK